MLLMTDAKKVTVSTIIITTVFTVILIASDVIYFLNGLSYNHKNIPYFAGPQTPRNPCFKSVSM